MSKYYVAGIPFDSENSLQHYGVKNMEWGKHKFGLDADSRYIKWLKDAGMNIGQFANRVGQNVGRAATTAARTAGTAVNRGANFVMGNQNRQNYQNAQRASQYSRNPQSSQQRSTNVYNQAQSKTLPGIATSTARKVGQTASEAARNAQNWAGQQARNVGNAVQNAANTVDQNLNITGNQDREKAEQFRKYADQAQSQVSKDYWNKKAAEADQKANSSLAGKASTTAQNVGNAVGGAAKTAGDWVGAQARNVGTAAQKAAKDIDRNLNITGDYARANAQSYRDLADFQEDQNAPFHAESPQYDPEYLRKKADEYDQRADNSLFSRVGNAASAVGNAAQDAGQWFGDRANDVGNFAGQAAQNVGKAAEQARGGIGGFFDRAGNAIGNAANGAKEWAGQTAQNAGNWVDQKLNLTDNQNTAEADRYRNLANQAESQVSKDYWNNKVSEAQQDARDNSLLGRIGNAANAAGNWVGDRASDVGNAAQNAVGGAKGFINSAGHWVSDTADNVGRAAQDTAKKAETGAKGFINSAGKWVSTAAGNVKSTAQDAGQAVGNAANAAGNWIGDRASDVGNAAQNVGQTIGSIPGNVKEWYTGDNAKHLAFRNGLDAGPEQRYGESLMRMATDFRPEANDAYERYSENPALSRVQDFAQGLGAYRNGLQMQKDAQDAQQRYENAPRQKINNAMDAAGQWLGNRANEVGNVVGAAGNWVGDRAREVGGAVGNAAGVTGEWLSDRASDVGDFANAATKPIRDWYTGQPYADSSEEYGRKANAISDWIGTGMNLVDYYQQQADAAREAGNASIADEWQGYADKKRADLERYRRLSERDAEEYRNAPRQKLRNFIPVMQHSAIDEKPEGVSDAFWEKFVADGGTREEYERDWR